MNGALHPVAGGDESSAVSPDVNNDRSEDWPLISAAPKQHMPFWQLFLRVLPANPVAAAAAAYWHLTRRRVRARNRLVRVAALLPAAYEIWIRQAEQRESLAESAKTRPTKWVHRPRFLVLVRSGGVSADAAKATVCSLNDQIYPQWTVNVLLEPGEQVQDLQLDDRISSEFLGSDGDLSSALASDFDYLVPLQGGEMLARSALLRIAEAAQSPDRPLLIYGDHDEMAEDGLRQNPWFKPDWNYEMFLALDYLSPAVAIHKTIARSAAQSAHHPVASRDKFLVATAALAQGRVFHIPHILAHVLARDVPPDPEGRLAAVQAQLQGENVRVEAAPFDTIKVSWPLPPALPLVSIIIPTRDKLELLRPCVETLIQRTSYRQFEVLVVDNRSSDPEALRYLARLNDHPQVKVLAYDEDYNFSAINNFAARYAAGNYLCMLNNDTEIIDGEWLAELMRYAVRPEIGAVGAKLLYPDRKIQHAGVVVGLGGAAGHAHRFDAADEPGYFRQAHVAQFVSAVTAACLVVSKEKFCAVGGLDEEGFAVAFNDVDFCLKLAREGWRNVYTPHAVLLHHESKSRGKDHAPANVARFTQEHALLQRRWRTETYRDPFHSPNLDRRSERFIIDL